MSLFQLGSLDYRKTWTILLNSEGDESKPLATIMTDDEKRKNPRIDSHNLISFTCHDEDNQESIQGMGRTLNVSEGGLLMEIHHPIDPNGLISVAVAVEDDLLEFEGRISYCKEHENGKFEAGIQFLDIDESTQRLLKQLMVIFEGMENDD